MVKRRGGWAYAPHHTTSTHNIALPYLPQSTTSYSNPTQGPIRTHHPQPHCNYNKCSDQQKRWVTTISEVTTPLTNLGDERMGTMYCAYEYGLRDHVNRLRVEALKQARHDRLASERPRPRPRKHRMHQEPVNHLGDIILQVAFWQSHCA